MKLSRSIPPFLWGAAILLSVVAGVDAGKFNKVLSIKDKAPEWELKGVDGKQHSSADLKQKAATVVVFTCNTCPYATDIEGRLKALATKFADRSVAVVAINANHYGPDELDAMKKRAKEQSYNYPYLRDDDQAVAKAFGAFYTPEFFVLNKQWQVLYMGSLDDSPDGSKVKIRFVEEALEEVLAGKEVSIKETVPIGCKVRFPKRRRQRK